MHTNIQPSIVKYYIGKKLLTFFRGLSSTFLYNSCRTVSWISLWMKIPSIHGQCVVNNYFFMYKPTDLNPRWRYGKKCVHLLTFPSYLPLLFTFSLIFGKTHFYSSLQVALFVILMSMILTTPILIAFTIPKTKKKGNHVRSRKHTNWFLDDLVLGCKPNSQKKSAVHSTCTRQQRGKNITLEQRDRRTPPMEFPT